MSLIKITLIFVNWLLSFNSTIIKLRQILPLIDR